MRSTPFWLWLNFLSLDAPIVAVVWQDFASYCFNSPLRWPGRLALGLTVWAIYLADRLIDVRHPPSVHEPPRHVFYRRHGRFAHALLTAVILADVLVALLWLRPLVLEYGLFVGAMVAFYLAGFAVLRAGGSASKRPSAAILFTSGVFLVAFAFAGGNWFPLLWPAIAFCTLCYENLMLIETWERHRQSRRWPAILILCFACVYLGLTRMNQYEWYSGVFLSALGLIALDLLRARLSQDARRVLADFVLLTPLVFPR